MLKYVVNLHSVKAMMTRPSVRICFITGICLFICTLFLAKGQTYAPAPRVIRKGEVMSVHASGTFEVKLTPRPSKEAGEAADLFQMSIDKQFHGDLEAVSKGEMLADNMGDKGSGGYVAMERVSGRLHGHQGTFVLQHSGTMRNGVGELSITVVPESATGQLTGLEGKMTIKVVNGKHTYDFEYMLVGTPAQKANE